MRNTLRYLLPILLLGFLSGCSVFGIATKGDLNQQNEELSKSLADQKLATDDRMARAADEQQALDDQLAYVTGQMEAMNSELNLAVADLESRNEATAADLADMRIHFEMIQGQLQLALADLESVADAASRAEAGSRQAVQLHQDASLAERERLRARLQELDSRISAWYPAEVPTEQLQRELRPEVPSSAQAQNVAASSGNDEPQSRPGLQIPESVRKVE